MDIKQLANNAKSLDTDDAVDLVEDLEEKDQTIFLENLDKEERTLVEEGLNYPQDSAGRLMQRQFVAVNQSWNVGQAIDYLRNKKITLEDEKTRLKTDYKYIEEMAREKYRMAKKGEKVFKVIEEKEEN